MSIESTFQELFNLVYSGNNRDRDVHLLLDCYFPPQPHLPLYTLQELADQYPDISSRERVRQIKETFENNIRNYKEISETFPSIKIEIISAFKKIEENGCFISIEELSATRQSARSLAGIFQLGSLLNIHNNQAQLIENNQRGYIIPINVEKIQINKGLGSTRKSANHYGSVYPFSKLSLITEWDFIPSQQKIYFIKGLLQNEERYIELGDGDFFGFLGFSRDRILSRLVQIFTVYERVPIDNLVKSLHRTIKKRLISDKDADLDTLEECSDVFGEYCIRAGYCFESNGYFLASDDLRKYIHENPQPDDDMFLIECTLVKRLQKNGHPMITSDFINLMRETGANVSHIMEFAGLIYRTGYRRNSIYHTLDDQYIIQDQVIQPVDRNRIEINRIIRDTHLAKKVKRLCQYQCQICGNRLQIGDEEFYSEVHHIRPLGDPHNGPDTLENMLCVCPNCHVQLDYGAIPINISRLRFIERNPLSIQSINYHNQVIFHSEVGV